MMKRRGWQPGQSGNPGGRPKVAEEIKEAFRARSSQALVTLITLLDSPEDGVRLRAAEAILDRAWGKPTQSTEVAVSMSHSEAHLEAMKALAEAPRVIYSVDEDDSVRTA